MDATLGEDIEKLEIEGIGTVTEPKRVYPQGYLASQVLGLVGTDNVGPVGARVLAGRGAAAARTASAGS